MPDSMPDGCEGCPFHLPFACIGAMIGVPAEEYEGTPCEAPSSTATPEATP